MRLSRKIAVEFAGVFVIGALAGALAMWNFTDTELTKFMKRTNDPESVIVARINQKYTTQYHLSSEEMNRIQPLIQEMARHISQARRQFGTDILGTVENYHRQIAAELTPDHRALYLRANEERSKQISKMLLLDPQPKGPESR